MRIPVRFFSWADRNSYVDKKISGGIYPLTNTFICPTNATCGTMQPDSPTPWANIGLPFPDDSTNSAGVFNLATPSTITTTLSGKYVHMNDFCGSISEGSRVVRKAKGLIPINPNQTYVDRIVFDGANFNVYIDGALIITMAPGGTVPQGTAGFKVKKTTGRFDYISVN
jgi:hypothetical protein